jgi:hypothetical protein
MHFHGQFVDVFPGPMYTALSGRLLHDSQTWSDVFVQGDTLNNPDAQAAMHVALATPPAQYEFTGHDVQTRLVKFVHATVS